jgi:peptide deformylase
MSLLEIITIPNEVLRRKARKRTDFGPQLQTLIDDMIETMRAAPGVGLAAPQVGVSERLIVIEYGEDDDDGEEPEKKAAPKKLFAVVNPEITRTSDETVVGIEGCLSVPNLLGEVERYEAITVKGFNRRGQPMAIKAKGWLARVFQHEIDHLDGIIYVDRAQRVWQPENPEEFAAYD